MAKINSLQTIGIVVVVVSLLVGGVGTIACIYKGFVALHSAQNAGIGSVGDLLRNALFFTVGGIVGCVAGIVLLTVGRAKN
jgi:hypothetical protein